MQILNLYAGIGGNRKGWNLTADDKVVAIELNPGIAQIYKNNFPDDEVIIADAHQYLLEHFKEFDFIWSSPPCPTHSKIRKQLAYKKLKDGTLFEQNKPVYPNMVLYEEIIFLEHYFKGYYCVENVIPYYEPLIDAVKIGRHLFWSNIELSSIKVNPRSRWDDINGLADYLGFDISNWNNVGRKDTILRNCVEPEISKYIFNKLKEDISNE